MKIQVNVPTPKFVPMFLTFTKHNFLNNAPLVFVPHPESDFIRLAVPDPDWYRNTSIITTLLLVLTQICWPTSFQ